eukprot:gene57103-biopygen107225
MMFDIGKTMRAHTWFAVFFRLPGEQYTRVQRLVVVFSGICTCFFVLCAFAGTGKENASVVKVAAKCIMASMMMMPTNVILRLLFIRSKMKAMTEYTAKMPDPYSLQPRMGELIVRVVEAQHLPNLDSGAIRGDEMVADVSDPFCIVEFENKTWKTHTVWDNLNPVWENQVVSFPVRSEQGKVMIRVLDDDGAQLEKLADPLGGLTIQMSYREDALPPHAPLWVVLCIGVAADSAWEYSRWKIHFN